MAEAPPASHAYLLRLWQSSSGDTPVWRASLANVQTGERIGFGDLARLFAFLEAQTGSAPKHDDRPPSP